MAGEIPMSTEGLDVANIRGSQNQVTEEAVKRVQEQDQQAKQVQQQIQKDQAKNTKVAAFVTFLLKDIKDNELIRKLHSLFFKVKHPETGILYNRKSINTSVLAGFFLPFYPQQVQQFQLDQLYAPIYKPQDSVNIGYYLQYLQQLSAHFHDNIPLDKANLLDFVLHVLVYYKVSAANSLEEKNMLKQQIEHSLYRA